MTKARLFAASLTVTMLVLAGIALFGTTIPAQGQQIQPQPINRVAWATLYPATALVTGTHYTPVSVTGPSGVNVADWSSFSTADLFVLVDGTSTVSLTFGLTATVQAGIDGVNWADLTYDYWTGSAIAQQIYRRTFSVDGNSLMRVPVAGQFVRLKFDVVGPVTPTVQIAVRN